MAKELLKDVTVRNAKATDKDRRLNDGEGLYIIIKPNGAKWWRFDYTFASKRKTLSVGVYPATGLADARRKAADARNQISNGINPSDTRKELKEEALLIAENEARTLAGLTVINSFEHIAREWGETHIHDWLNKNNRSRRMLERIRPLQRHRGTDALRKRGKCQNPRFRQRWQRIRNGLCPNHENCKRRWL